jgi:hypothetical protein
VVDAGDEFARGQHDLFQPLIDVVGSAEALAAARGRSQDPTAPSNAPKLDAPLPEIRLAPEQAFD